MTNNQPTLVLHFDKSLVVPASTSWSLTVYNAEDFKPAHSLNSMMTDTKERLEFNDDGSLDIYVQKGEPGNDRNHNWLPSPNGQFFLVMRMSWPEENKGSATQVLERRVTGSH